MSTTLNTRIYIRTNAVTHMFTYISNRISFSFHLTFPFFVSIKVIFWGRFPFINFICRFTITIVTPKYHKLNFSRSVMLRGGHRPSNKGGGHPDPEIRWGGGLKQLFFRSLGPQIGPKITGRPGPPGPLPWIRYQWLLNCQPNLKIVSRYPITFQIIRNSGRKQNHPESASESLDCYGNSKVITGCQ